MGLWVVVAQHVRDNKTSATNVVLHTSSALEEDKIVLVTVTGRSIEKEREKKYLAT